MQFGDAVEVSDPSMLLLAVDCRVAAATRRPKFLVESSLGREEQLARCRRGHYRRPMMSCRRQSCRRYCAMKRESSTSALATEDTH